MRTLLRVALTIPIAIAAVLTGAQPAAAKELHVGPGASIQAAINTAKPGDTIVVDPGTYPENLLITKDRVRLRGAGIGQTMLVPGVITPAPACSEPGAPPTINGICAVGEFDPATMAPGEPVKGTSIEGFTITGFTGFGILLLNAKDSSVEATEAHHNLSYGISGFILSGVRFENNVAHDNGDPGFYIGDSAHAKAKVIGNTSYHNGVGGPEGFGMLFRDSSDGEVRDNNVYDNCAGIVFADTGEDPLPDAHWDATGNQVNHNNGACFGAAGGPPPTSGIGILLLGTKDVKVEKNVVLGNAPTGPTIASGGVIVASSTAFGGTDPTDNQVEKNTLHGNAPDIVWDGSGKHNSFKHNDCDTSVPASICGP